MTTTGAPQGNRGAAEVHVRNIITLAEEAADLISTRLNGPVISHLRASLRSVELALAKIVDDTAEAAGMLPQHD